MRIMIVLRSNVKGVDMFLWPNIPSDVRPGQGNDKGNFAASKC